jgi:hypothetical protein
MPALARLAVVAVVAAALLVASTTPAAPAKRAGTWWEVTSEAKGIREAAPPRTEKECLPLNFEEEPRSKEGDACKIGSVQRAGNKISWKLTCDGAPATVELVRSGDTFTSTGVFRTPSGEVRWLSRGKKLGGSCDPDEKDRLEAALAAYEKRGLHGAEQICANAIEELDPAPFAGDAVICTDPQQKVDFCESAQSPEGLRQLSEPGKEAQRKAAAAFCGVDEAKLRARH